MPTSGSGQVWYAMDSGILLQAPPDVVLGQLAPIREVVWADVFVSVAHSRRVVVKFLTRSHWLGWPYTGKINY